MPSALRSQPPLDLVEQCLRCAGISSIHDSTLFKKEFIQLQALEDLLPLLEPFYLPCKAIDILHEPLTPSRAITVYRHILKSHNSKLVATEKTFMNSKAIWYSVQTPLFSNSDSNSNSNLTVCFE